MAVQISRRQGLISLNEGQLPNITIAWNWCGLRAFIYVAVWPGLRWSWRWPMPRRDLPAMLGLGDDLSA